MFRRDKRLHIVAKNKKTDDRLNLFYSVLDIDITNRWMNLININNDKNNSIRYNYRKILSDDEILENFQEFKDNIIYINNNYDRILSDIVDVEYLRNNQHILNDLHQEFEIYGDRLAYLVNNNYFSNPQNFPEYNEKVWIGEKNKNNKLLHESFLKLNEQIHNFETIYRTWNNRQSALCTCLWDFIPAGLHEELKPEDYFLFNPSHSWGWAYLGYNTLGKHWSSACHDNDIEVVLRKQIRPQSRFAAETYLNFSLFEQGYIPQINLYNWWLKNNFSEIINPDDMKLKDLAFGFIPVAMISSYQINDGDIISIDRSIVNKRQWNKEVWSNFNYIESAKIK